jgi:hypothetical protein
VRALTRRRDARRKRSIAILKQAGLVATTPSSGTFVLDGNIGDLRQVLYDALQARATRPGGGAPGGGGGAPGARAFAAPPAGAASHDPPEPRSCRCFSGAWCAEGH